MLANPILQGQPAQVTNVAGLSTYGGILLDGDWIYCKSTKQYFKYDAQDTTTTVDNEYCFAAPRTGRLFLILSVATNSTRTDWWVDSATGSDSNDGSEASPLATMKELALRLAWVRGSDEIFVHIVSNVAADDHFVWNPTVVGGNDGLITITFVGTLSVAYDGMATAPTPSTLVPATNAPAKFTDTGIAGWEIYARKLIIAEMEPFTIDAEGIPNAPMAQIQKDLTGGTAQVSNWGNPSTGDDTAPGALTAYTILNVPVIASNIQISGPIDVTFSSLKLDCPSVRFPLDVFQARYVACLFPDEFACALFTKSNNLTIFQSCSIVYDDVIDVTGKDLQFYQCGFMGTQNASRMKISGPANVLLYMSTFEGQGFDVGFAAPNAIGTGKGGGNVTIDFVGIFNTRAAAEAALVVAFNGFVSLDGALCGTNGLAPYGCIVRDGGTISVGLGVVSPTLTGVIVLAAGDLQNTQIVPLADAAAVSAQSFLNWTTGAGGWGAAGTFNKHYLDFRGSGSKINIRYT